jgi:peptide-methionine (R)-S-oxide reductase
MKKRYFLSASATVAGVTWLSQYLPGRARTPIATAQSTTAAFEVTKSAAEWRKILTPEQFHVLREQGTERAGSSALTKAHDPGTFACAGCALPLFTTATKYDSGTGWPSFYAPIADAVDTTTDQSAGMTRVEVHCHRCGGHLGHVFNDGPQPTGKRYCMNGVAMKFTAS